MEKHSANVVGRSSSICIDFSAFFQRLSRLKEPRIDTVFFSQIIECFTRFNKMKKMKEVVTLVESQQ